MENTDEMWNVILYIYVFEDQIWQKFFTLNKKNPQFLMQMSYISFIQRFMIK